MEQHNEQQTRGMKPTEAGIHSVPDRPLPRGKRILRHLVKGVCFTTLVLALKLSVEHSPFGHELERISFDFLQRLLSSKEVPVYIVDISTLKPREINRNGKTDLATPREELQMLIAAIADEKPRVIGVDIDFAPDEEGFITSGDPAFFEFCRGLRQTGKKAGVPVFLGVERSVTAGLPPNVWLGNKEYEELAACIIIPKQDTRKMPLRMLASEEFVSTALTTSHRSIAGRTMSAALANVLQEKQSLLLESLHRAGLVEQISEIKLPEQGGKIEQFPVDYSPLETLIEQQTLRPKDEHQSLSDLIREQGRLLRDKIVLIGDATLGEATDTFLVQGQAQPIPGVYVHACAAYTLAFAPLHEFTGLARVIIDFLLSVAVILVPIACLRWYYNNRTPREVAVHRLQGILTWVAVLGALVCGVWFVSITRLLWTDFIMVIGALLLHPAIERHGENLWGYIRQKAPPTLRDVVFEQEEEGHQ